MKIIFVNINIVFKSALRHHSLWTNLFFSVLVIATALVVGNASGRQPYTVTYDIGFSLGRILLPMFGILWVLEHLAKDIDKKSVIWSCAVPLNRASYLLGKFMGVYLLQLLSMILFSILLYAAIYVIAPSYRQGTPLQGGLMFFVPFLGLALDLLVILSFCLLVSVVATSSALPLFTGFLFLIVCRSLGPTIAYVRVNANLPHDFLAVLETFAWFLPDLSHLDVREIVLYNKWPAFREVQLAIIQVISYIFLLCFAACQAFKRREFI